MSGRGPMTRLVALALVSASGIVGMLLVDSPTGDRLLLAVAALPLVYGGWSWRAQRRLGADCARARALTSRRRPAR